MINNNQKELYRLTLLFWGIALSRILLIIYFPLMDTTEARYANIGLIMSKTKDWITPYFDYGVPYWGKPPLAFWFEAISYNIFGIHDFTPRIPAFLITLCTAWIVYKAVTVLNDKKTALWAIIIYFSSLLVYTLSGVVLLDQYLTFAVTLSYISFLMLVKNYKKQWGYLFFIGLGVGLLAKGPLALVLVGGVIFLWVILSFKKRVRYLSLLPWFSGTFLMLLIALPWYILAEHKTPGFLHYFIVGEHIDRFLYPGWKGDLYGHAHLKPKGTVWFMWLYCSLPWGIIGLWLTLRNLFTKTKREIIISKMKKDDISFLILWMLFPMIFFTMAANITQTYILYGFPALGILLSLYYNSLDKIASKKIGKLFVVSSLISPLIGIFGTFYVIKNASKLKTEKYLIYRYRTVAKHNEPIYFLNHKEFSETYYLDQKINPISLKDLKIIQKNNQNKKYFVVVSKGDDKLFANDYKLIYKSSRHILYEHTKNK